MIQFSLKDLNPYLTCTLCRGYFREAHTIPECMHTFCRVCILKHFHQNKSSGPISCPMCDIKLGPYVSANTKVIYDRNLQSIVDKLFPYFIDREKEEYEQFLLSEGMKVNKRTASEMTSSNQTSKDDSKRRKEGDEYHFKMVPDVDPDSSESLVSFVQFMLEFIVTDVCACMCTVCMYVYTLGWVQESESSSLCKIFKFLLYVLCAATHSETGSESAFDHKSFHGTEVRLQAIG